MTAVRYLEAAVVIAAIAAPIHYLVGLDWPWAIVLGTAGSMLVRALVYPRTPPPASGVK
jgi:hypothetical protein